MLCYLGNSNPGLRKPLNKTVILQGLILAFTLLGAMHMCGNPALLPEVSGYPERDTSSSRLIAVINFCSGNTMLGSVL